MKTREEIINNMCMTYRHDYGLEISEDDRMYTLMSGMTKNERVALYNTMAQIFDNDIAPLVDSAMKYEAGAHCPIPTSIDQAKAMVLMGHHYLSTHTNG